MKLVKDLIMARDKAKGKQATMHIVESEGKFHVINDLLSGSIVFTSDTIKECEDWYFDRLISGFTKVNV